MTVHEDIVDWQTSQIVTLQLASAGVGALVSDAVAPDYTPAASGAADLTAPLDFTGDPDQAVTHVVFNRAGGEWFRKALSAGSGDAFNSDGAYRLTTAEITNVLV